MIEINKLYNDDCLHKMQFIDDKSIDAIITDSEYNTQEQTATLTQSGTRMLS